MQNTLLIPTQAMHPALGLLAGAGLLPGVASTKTTTIKG
jgi:hypothetical protein